MMVLFTHLAFAARERYGRAGWAKKQRIWCLLILMEAPFKKAYFREALFRAFPFVQFRFIQAIRGFCLWQWGFMRFKINSKQRQNNPALSPDFITQRRVARSSDNDLANARLNQAGLRVIDFAAGPFRRRFAAS